MNIFNIIIVIVLIYILYRLPSVEKMSNIDVATENKIREIYKIDTDAIRNLSNLAKDLTVNGKLKVPGGLEIDGGLKVKGFTEQLGGGSVEGKLYLRHTGANGSDDSDPYHLEKVRTSANNNHLRLTINDDADESFQIWGNSCGSEGGCAGVGRELLKLDGNGNLTVNNSINLGNTNTILRKGDGNSLRIQTNSGWTDIGAQNDGWSHIYTDRPKFAFNKTITDVETIPYRDYTKNYIARYIRIGNTDMPYWKDYWTLIEAEVYNTSNVNVARGKTVTFIQGSVILGTSAVNAVNGRIFNGRENHDNWPNGIHGNIGHHEIEIDLGSDQHINHIILYNRWDGSLDSRMDGTHIKLYDSARRLIRVINTGLWHRQYSKTFTL
jgi:hypothetical protein